MNSIIYPKVIKPHIIDESKMIPPEGKNNNFLFTDYEGYPLWGVKADDPILKYFWKTGMLWVNDPNPNPIPPDNTQLLRDLSIDHSQISEDTWKMTKTLLNLAWLCYGRVYGGFIRDLIAGVEPSDIDIVFVNTQGTSKDFHNYSYYNRQNFLYELGKFFVIDHFEEILNPEYGRNNLWKVTIKVRRETSNDMNSNDNESFTKLCQPHIKRMRKADSTFTLDLSVRKEHIRDFNFHADFDVNQLFLHDRTLYWKNRDDFTKIPEFKFIDKRLDYFNFGVEYNIDSIIHSIHNKVCTPAKCGENCHRYLKENDIHKCENEFCQCSMPRYRIEKMLLKGWNISNMPKMIHDSYLKNTEIDIFMKD